MDVFLKEYSSEQAIRRYTGATAGFGINYLLDTEYCRIYLRALCKYAEHSAAGGVRILEFGCGGGMNLIRLLPVLERQGIRITQAFGTDFSASLLAAAREEAANYLPPQLVRKVSFFIARNESLINDLTKESGAPREDLAGRFHLILGVNTMRYCHRLRNQNECVSDIFDLLVPGGVCVMIDMNPLFPFFRSRLRSRATANPDETYVPTLEKYSEPFVNSGFQLLEKSTFCWVPHSAGPFLTSVARILTPLLNLLFLRRAMRVLVVARKPAAGKRGGARL